jgi:hypothetical protein
MAEKLMDEVFQHSAKGGLLVNGCARITPVFAFVVLLFQR